jgi:hypothetical protein
MTTAEKEGEKGRRKHRFSLPKRKKVEKFI